MDVDKIRAEKLEKLKAMSDQVRIGGKGSARRKKKVIHKNAAADDKKLQTSLKRLNLNPIPAIEEVNMYKSDGTMLHFKNPEVKASPQANVFAVSGQAETKYFFPTMRGCVENARLLLSESRGKTNEKDAKAENDDVPDLVEDFDVKSRLE